MPDRFDAVRTHRRIARAAPARVEELAARGVSAGYLYGESPSALYSALNAFFLLLDLPERYGLPAEPERPQLHLRGDYLRAAFATLLGIGIIAATLLNHAF